MITDALKTLFKRDLEKLITELEAYSSETNIWQVDNQIANSAGTLALHLIGNLKAFIGASFANTGYVRQRPLEFSQRDVPRAELIEQIKETIDVVDQGLNNITSEQLLGDFPIQIWDKPTGMTFTLMHLLSHLNYHLGQVNYHRRLLDVPS